MARVIRRITAVRDLIDHYVFLGENASVEIARRFLRAANESFEDLARMPAMGISRTFRNPKYAGVRKWAVKDFDKYLIFYMPLDDGIEVLRVVHGARDLEDLFR